MDYLRGMMDIISGNGINVKAIRKLTKEAKSYYARSYSSRFELSETFTIPEKYDKTVEVDVSHGYIGLTYKNHNFLQTITIFGRWKNGPYEGKPTWRVNRKQWWRKGISLLSEKMFNEEVEKYRQAFLDDDPVVHDQIRAAVLQSMYIPVCDRCMNEKTENHACF